MLLEHLFEQAVVELTKRKIPFAVAGGFAMGLYRGEPRLTMDVDFAVCTGMNHHKLAIAVVESLGLKFAVARKADLDGGPAFLIKSGKSKPCIIVGRVADSGSSMGVDLMLPELCWVEEAVARAQDNKVDFGFGPVPTLTREDAILSKLCALQKLRAKDLDDLQSIFETDSDVDHAYLSGQIKRYGVFIPVAARPFLPSWLIRLARG